MSSHTLRERLAPSELPATAFPVTGVDRPIRVPSREKNLEAIALALDAEAGNVDLGGLPVLFSWNVARWEAWHVTQRSPCRRKRGTPSSRTRSAADKRTPAPQPPCTRCTRAASRRPP